MQAKLPKYKDVLAKKKDVDAELLPERLGKAEATATLEIAKIKEDLKTRQLALKKSYMSPDLNFATIAKLLDDIEIVARKLGQYEKIKQQMF